GACPTLLLPSALYSIGCSQDLFTELLQLFYDGTRAWREVKEFPGDPWKRVEKVMASLPEMVSAGLKGEQNAARGAHLAAAEAREFARLQLNPKNLGEEFKAFMFAWEGSINFTGLGAIAMPKDRFLQMFGRLALTLRLPFMRNIIDNPE